MKHTLLSLEKIAFNRGSFGLQVDLDFAPGRLTVVLGPSGSGKTTLLDLAAGFLRPDSGRVLENRVDVTGIPPEKRCIGVVFQDFALFPHMNVLRNVAFGLLMRGVGRSEAFRIAGECLELVRIPGFARRRPSSLSGGEKQRVALARALAIEPDLLLLDEPFSALDAALRRELRDEVARIRSETGITTVLVTHDQDEALALADELVVMKDGKVMQHGPPPALWESPENLFTASFLGRAIRLEIVEYRRNAKGWTAVTRAGAIPMADSAIRPELPATAVIRPEAARLSPNGSLYGLVASTEYAGGRWRIRLVSEGGETMECDFDGPAPPERDSLIRLDVESRSLRILPGIS